MATAIEMVDGVVELPARKYEDYDNCLAAALSDVAEATGLEAWELEASWGEGRNEIVVRKTSR